MATVNVRKEIENREASRYRILSRLRQGPATNKQLAKISLRFGARLKELRDSGVPIVTTYDGKPGRYSYHLKPE